MPVIKRKIKIIYDILPDIIGGTERFLFNMVKYIDRERFEPVIFSYSHGVATQMFKSLDVEVRIIDTNYLKRLSNLINFLKSSKVDIAQSNYFNYPLAMAANAACVLHIWRPGGHIDVCFPDANLKLKKYLLNIICALSKRIVCPTQFIKGQLEGVRASKIKIIHNGVALDEINSVFPDYRMLREAGCSKNDFAIGMAAHLIPHKRHIDFIRAARRVKKKLPNTKFFIVGIPYPNKESLDYAKYLYKKVKEMDMDKDIIFTGFCKDILKGMASMNVIILTSVGEPSSNALIEAMALGKPVIASGSGGNPELIEDRVTGLLVPPKNPKRLAEAIIEILKDPQRARMMGEGGRERAKRLFDIKRMVRQYEELYQDFYRESVRP